MPLRAMKLLPAAALVLMAGAGPAMAIDPPDLFQIPSGFSADALRSIFGGDLFPDTAGTVAHSQTVLGSIAEMLNIAIMAIATLLLLYYLVVTQAQTAHDGSVLGKRYNTLWAPIRVVMSIASMVPISGGFAAIQLVTAIIIFGGINLATWGYNAVIDSMFDRGLPVMTPKAPDTVNLMRGTYEILLCQQLVNRSLNASGSNVQIVRQARSPDAQTGLPSELVWGVSGTQRQQMWAQAQQHQIARGTSVPLVALADVCGRVTSSQVAHDTAAAASAERNGGSPSLNAWQRSVEWQLSQLHIAAYTSWLDDGSEMTRMARGVATAAYDATGKRGDGDVPAGTFAAVPRSIAGYEAYINNRLQVLTQQVRANSPVYQELKGAMRAEGWESIGAFYPTLSKMNAIVSRAAQLVPSVETPRWDVVKQLVGERAYSETVAPALAISQQWWDREVPTYDIADLSARMDKAGFGLPYQGLKPDTKPAGDDGDSTLTKKIKEAMQSAEDLFFDVLRAPVRAANRIVMGHGQDSLAADPLGRLVHLGQTMLDTTMVAITSYIAVAGVTAAVLSAVGSAGLTVLFTVISSPIGIGVTILITAVGTGGFFLAYVLPMMPALIWILAYLGWLVLCAEAIIAGPLWALAHLRLDGEGFAPQAGQNGYFIMLNLLLRPTLMIIGMIISLALFPAVVGLVMEYWPIATGSATLGADKNSIVSVMGEAVWLIIFIGVITTIAERLFGEINRLPDRVTRWIGGHGEQLMEEQDVQKSRGFGMVVAGQGSAATRATASAGQGIKPMQLGGGDGGRGPGANQVGSGPGAGGGGASGGGGAGEDARQAKALPKSTAAPPSRDGGMG